jgi:hypothetical protein
MKSGPRSLRAESDPDLAPSPILRERRVEADIIYERAVAADGYFELQFRILENVTVKSHHPYFRPKTTAKPPAVSHGRPLTYVGECLGKLFGRSLLGVKRTCLFASHMSAFDPKRASCRGANSLPFTTDRNDSLCRRGRYSP